MKPATLPNGAPPHIFDRADTSTTSRLSPAQLVERIIALNPTASADFLARFTHAALADYHEHLLTTTEPRGPASRWVRRDGTPAIIARSRRDEN